MLQTPGQPARRLRGTYSWELSPLRLRAGDKVTYVVEARDNDAVDGPQRGASATQVLKVFSAAEHSREALLRAQALWERLVTLTADRLEEKPAPPSDASGWYSATAAKDQGALQLVSDLQAAATTLIKDKLAPREVGRALRYAASSLGPAVRRTSLAREALTKQLRDYQDWTGIRVAVVFDGKGDSVSVSSDPGEIQIFYSREGQTADHVGRHDDPIAVAAAAADFQSLAAKIRQSRRVHENNIIFEPWGK